MPCRSTAALASARDTGATGITWRKLTARTSIVRTASIELHRTIGAWRPQVVHANMYPACLYAAFASWYDRVALVWHNHTIRPITRQNRLNYRFVGRLTAAIVNVSDACARNLREAGIPDGRMHTIYNGLDLRAFAPRDGAAFRRRFGLEGRRLIGLVGQPLPEKGHRVAIEATAAIVRRHPDAALIIVGYKYQSAYQRELDALVALRGLGSHVFFTGWQDDVVEALSAIEILAHTRVTPEPAALVLQEAMALGKPVVASDTGGTSELIADGETGLLVPPGDPERLAAAIGGLLDEPARQEAMGRAGRARVEERFTVDRQVRKMSGLYEWLAGGARRPV